MTEEERVIRRAAIKERIRERRARIEAMSEEERAGHNARIKRISEARAARIKDFNANNNSVENPDLTGKNVLVIGSGIDTTERQLKDDIDGGRWDYIIRVNRFYGYPENVGTKTDLYVLKGMYEVRELEGKTPGAPYTIASRALDRVKFNELRSKYGINTSSTGLKAIGFAKLCGAETITLIGYGYRNGEWTQQKTYPDGREDPMPAHVWEGEHRMAIGECILLD